MKEHLQYLKSDKACNTKILSTWARIPVDDNIPGVLFRGMKKQGKAWQ
jgi:hypothetical protein